MSSTQQDRNTEDFEFTLHDLVPKDDKVVFKKPEDYHTGLIYQLGL